jgi:hypothetical protein
MGWSYIVVDVEVAMKRVTTRYWQVRIRRVRHQRDKVQGGSSHGSSHDRQISEMSRLCSERKIVIYQKTGWGEGCGPDCFFPDGEDGS